MLAGHGVRNEVKRLRLGVGLPKVGDVHPIELGSGRHEVVLVDEPHADKHVPEVADGGGFRCHRNLELCLGHEVALQQHLLEPEVGPPIEPWTGGVRRRPILGGTWCLLDGCFPPSVGSPTCAPCLLLELVTDAISILRDIPGLKCRHASGRVKPGAENWCNSPNVHIQLPGGPPPPTDQFGPYRPSDGRARRAALLSDIGPFEAILKG